MPEPYDRFGVLDARVVDRLLSVADGDASFVEEVFSTYQSEGRRRMIALQQAARTRDVGRIVKEAHGLKGASLSAGAAQMTVLAREVEQHAKAGDFQSAIAGLDTLHHAFERTCRVMSSWQPGQ